MEGNRGETWGGEGGEIEIKRDNGRIDGENEGEIELKKKLAKLTAHTHTCIIRYCIPQTHMHQTKPVSGSSHLIIFGIDFSFLVLGIF